MMIGISRVLRAHPELPADLEPALQGEHQVQDHQVRQLDLRLAEAILAVVGHEDLEALALQVVRQDFDQGSLVFDDQDLRLGHGVARQSGDARPVCETSLYCNSRHDRE